MLHPTRHWRPGALRCLDANAGDVSGLRIELPQVEETGCFGAPLPPASAPGFITTSAKPNVTATPGAHPAARYDRPSALPKKYQRYQHLIAALQGFHARIKSTHYEPTTSATGPRPLIT